MAIMQDHHISDHVAYTRYVDGSLRSLRFLKNVEQACLIGGAIRDQLRSHLGPMKRLNDSLRLVEGPIPEDDLIPKLESVENSLELASSWLHSAHKSAKADPALREEDGVIETYREALDALCDLHAEVQEYRWAVMHHNAFLEQPTGNVVASAEEIKKFLAAL